MTNNKANSSIPDGNLKIELIKLPSNTKERIEVILSGFTISEPAFKDLFQNIENKLEWYKENTQKTREEVFSKEEPNPDQKQRSTKLIRELKKVFDDFMPAFEEGRELDKDANLALDRLECAGYSLREPNFDLGFPKDIILEDRPSGATLNLGITDLKPIYECPSKAIAGLYYLCSHALESQSFPGGRPSKSEDEIVLINLLIEPYCKATGVKPTAEHEGPFERFIVRILQDATSSYTEYMYSIGRGGDKRKLRNQIEETIKSHRYDEEN